MGFVTDESTIKQQSAFPKYEIGTEGNDLILKSNLYQIPFHFLISVNRSVKCIGEGCKYCEAGEPKRSEYNYYVSLNGQLGTLDIKPSVFFAIQDIAKAQKKDVRQISWTVIKTGQKTDTKYTTSKNDNLTSEEFAKAQAEIASFNEKLEKLMVKHEAQLTENYQTYLKDIREQKPDGVKERQINDDVDEDEGTEGPPF